MNYTVTQTSPMLIDVRMEYGAGWHQDFFLCSDVHYDNPKCDRNLFHAHLDEARERGAGILVFGDFLCLMQGKYDPRGTKSDIRPEHNNNAYLDSVFADTAERLKDYAPNFVLLADGNHETSILKRLEVNPLDHVAEKMNFKYGGNVHRGGYHGFVRFTATQGNAGTVTRLLYWHHGKYGGAVSKGTQGTSRHGLVVPQADVIVTGHTHDRWMVEQPRYYLRDNGEVRVRQQVHLKCGTYKEEFAAPGGWAVERIVMPKSIGGWWLRLSVERLHSSKKLRMRFAPA